MGAGGGHEARGGRDGDEADAVKGARLQHVVVGGAFVEGDHHLGERRARPLGDLLHLSRADAWRSSSDLLHPISADLRVYLAKVDEPDPTVGEDEDVARVRVSVEEPAEMQPRYS